MSTTFRAPVPTRGDGVLRRRLPVGAELVGTGVHFRVWAPAARQVEVNIEGGPASGQQVLLAPEDNGYFSGSCPHAGAGTLYRLQLDRNRSYADPASRFQPQGPHGPSEVIDASRFSWNDHDWRGPRVDRPLLYELHIGTFTRVGTWTAAFTRLPHLRDLGVNIIEIMPVADFPGRFGWGYDGVNLYAPTRLYGRPDDFRRFVDAAHALGMGVILDVVYNHFGPDGCVLGEFARAYFSDRHVTDWGAAINFDGPDSGSVREYFVSNAGYWISEFHLDGLRLDATQNIYDTSRPSIITQVAARVREAAGARRSFVVAENETQQAWLLRAPSGGGAGLDALWNDDFHHSARVAMTGRAEAYYTDYRGTAQELISASRWGFLYQGQYYSWQDKPRGSPVVDIPLTRFVHYLQNHDQVANSRTGERLHQITSPGRWRAMTALLLLGPASPMLFQGQEFAASAPFLFFADHQPELARQVRQGRRAFLSQFASLATSEAQALLPDPMDDQVFEKSRLDWAELERNQLTLALHRDLIRLARLDPALQRRERNMVQGATLSEECLALRFSGHIGNDRLLLVNLGRQLTFVPAPEPLLAPPALREWRLQWSSESPQYGGAGTPPVERQDGWHIPAECAVVLAARARLPMTPGHTVLPPFRKPLS
ncbi:MAG: malto-oligosyltrehalose trehalohydrolase [Longimicrobiales bacterium]